MAELIEEYKRLRELVKKAVKEKNDAALHAKIHIIDHAKERQKRRENPSGSTRIIIDCKSPEGYKELRPEIDRYFDIAGDPHIAINLLAWALHAFSDETIRQRINLVGHEPMPEMPPWLK